MNATTFSHFPNLAIAAEGVELITSDESPLWWLTPPFPLGWALHAMELLKATLIN